MSVFTVFEESRHQSFSHLPDFLEKIRMLLKAGARFRMIFQDPTRTIGKLIKDVFREFDLEVVLDPDSDASAADYVFNGVAGAVVGGSLGLGIVTLAALCGVIFPPSAFCTAGAVAGATLALVATKKWGLRIRPFEGHPTTFEAEMAPRS